MNDYYQIQLDVVDSTNTYLKTHYLDLNNFTFVRALFQSKGKGRNERIWNSDKGENLLFSLLIKDFHLLSYGGYLSLVAATSICKIMEKFNINPLIKWPNDIYVNDKKICGILLEGKIPEYIIIGCGININQKEFVGEYRIPPTSLFLEINQNINIDEIQNLIYRELFDELTNIDNNKKDLFDYFYRHNYLENKSITISDFKNCSFDDIDDNFNLIIADKNGNKHIITSGELIIE